MMKRLYVNNFRCLDNFPLEFDVHSSLLLLGRNGVGKTTVALALRVLQAIGRGTSRVGDLLTPEDMSRGRTDVPVRFEIEVLLAGKTFASSVALEFPNRFPGVAGIGGETAGRRQPHFHERTRSGPARANEFRGGGRLSYRLACAGSADYSGAEQ
jgi:predicted ATPase